MIFRDKIKKKLRPALIKIGYCSKPSFLIIGAQKAGTTSLFQWMKEHPCILPSLEKELHFFDREAHFKKGLNHYHSQFPLPHHFGKNHLTFEATPIYLYHPKIPFRLYEYNKALKLIVLLRNPIDRAYSAWNMFRTWATAKNSNIRSFEELVIEEINKIPFDDIEASDLVRRGIYYEQFQRYLKYFPRNQILIIETNQFHKNKKLTLKEITDFLEIPEYEPNILENMNAFHAGNYETQMTPQIKKILTDFYKPQNKKLFHLLDREFDW